MKKVVCVYVKDNLILGTEDYREDFHLPDIQGTLDSHKGWGSIFWMSGAVLHVAGCLTPHDLLFKGR